MSPSNGGLSVEQGRAMVARARRYKVIERTAIVVSGLAIPMFAASYIELRRLDDAVIAGGEMGVPYFAYTAIVMFLAGTVVLFLMRHLIAVISRALAAEQERRWMEDGEPEGEATAVDARMGERSLPDPATMTKDTPAAAG